MEFTVGFIFTQNLEEVLLILKDRPSWQAGLWNGVGGKLEKNETLRAGISREVKEETDIQITEESWKIVGTLTGKEWKVTIFTTTLDNPLPPTQKTSEKPAWHHCAHLPTNLIPNLAIIIPACLHTLTTNNPPTLRLTYHD